jgi:tetratricopeptide (TPR) repeat protein
LGGVLTRKFGLIFALLAWGAAVAVGEDTPPPSFEDAQVLFEERRYPEAQDAFAALHESFPDHPGVLMYLGKLAAKRQERKQAMDYLAQAVALVPDDAELQFEYAAACGFYASTLGTSLKALRYARQAGKSLQRSIELEPDNLSFRQGFIEFSLEAPAIAGGGSRRAHAQAAAIAERNPVKGAYAWAMIHRAEGNHADALASLEELISLAPDNYFALFNFGRCAAESGQRLEEGRAHLQRCLELPAPDQAAPPAHVWWNIATIEKRLGDRPAAVAALREAVALAPHDARIAEDLATTLAEEA